MQQCLFAKSPRGKDLISLLWLLLEKSQTFQMENLGRYHQCFATGRLASLLQTDQTVSAPHFLRFLQAGRQAGHAEEGAVLSGDVKQKSGQLPPG